VFLCLSVYDLGLSPGKNRAPREPDIACAAADKFCLSLRSGLITTSSSSKSRRCEFREPQFTLSHLGQERPNTTQYGVCKQCWALDHYIHAAIQLPQYHYVRSGGHLCIELFSIHQPLGRLLTRRFMLPQHNYYPRLLWLLLLLSRYLPCGVDHSL
jgi:hypothetical protein